MIQVLGKNGISAKIICDSISESGIRMTTFEWEFHRWILAEANTHRAISKNLQSSRAIPLSKAIEMVVENMAEPTHWGKNQPGMQSKEELTGDDLKSAKKLWASTIGYLLSSVQKLSDIGAHKQWAARLLEPGVMTKGVFSGTDWDNLLWLRNDEDAQPEFKELARCTQECLDQSVPRQLLPGEWHLPYVEVRLEDNRIIYEDSEGVLLSLEDAQKISASCCAQVSYRRLNELKSKALEIYHKLFAGRKPHMSPTEHQATPIFSTSVNVPWNPQSWENGVTHVSRDGVLHSGNLTGWVQYRQTLENNVFKRTEKVLFPWER